MFDLAFLFRSPEMLALWVLSAVAGALVLYRLWPWLRRGRRLAALAASLFALHAAILTVWAATVRVDSDEVSHLHCSWLIFHGLVPYRDFWQDHSPLLWYLLAPAVAQFHSPAVLIFSRALAGLLFVGMAATTAWLAWEVSRLRAAGALAALLVFAFGVRAEAALLRPDQPANLLALVSLVLGAKAGVQRGPAWLAGTAFGLALAFTPKPVFAAFAIPLAVLIALPSPESKGSRPQRVMCLAYYLLGLMAGFVPLVFLLARAKIGPRYLFWVLQYHVPAGRVESYLPATLALVAFGGCVAAFQARTGRAAARAVAASGSAPGSSVFSPQAAASSAPVVIAFILTTLTGLVSPSRTPASLMLWVALAAVLGSPLLLACLLGDTASKAQGTSGASSATANLGPCKLDESQLTSRSGSLWLKVGVVALVLLECEALAPLLNRPTLGDFAADRARMAWMIQRAGDRPVLLVTPVHDIYSRDATGLYELWQYSHYLRDPAVNASFSGLAKAVISSRPALIAVAPRRITDDPEPLSANRPRLFDTLVGFGLLTPAEWQALDQFLRDNYSLVEMNGEAFYVAKR